MPVAIVPRDHLLGLNKNRLYRKAKAGLADRDFVGTFDHHTKPGGEEIFGTHACCCGNLLRRYE